MTANVEECLLKTPEVEGLLQDLQSRYAFQEDLLNSLNATVVAQGRQIEQLQRQCQHLQQVIRGMAEDVEQMRPATNERPPHY